jgi:uridylate kinase
MSKESEIVVISLGGSIIVPGEIDTKFLKGFRELILKHIRKGKRFIIISGGGKTCRKYQEAASRIVKLSGNDLDWIGIHATRLNAHLLGTIFRNHAKKTIVKDPRKRISFREKIMIAAGWEPGFSTDYDAVLLARQFKIKTLINLSDIDYVHDKDPKYHRNAKPFKNIGWKEFRKIVGNRWDPGLNKPFDPIASREAQKLGMRVVIMKGSNLKNMDSFLSGKKFRGTVIG